MNQVSSFTMISLLRLIFVVGTLTVLMSVMGCSSQMSKASERECVEDEYGPISSLRENWGVEVLGIHTTATGYLLDFRYRVVDAEKAAPLLDRRIKPYLLVEKSEAKLGVPVTNKLGALRQTTQNVQAERNYFVLFTNPSRHVKAGDRVSVVIGDFVAENLQVM